MKKLLPVLLSVLVVFGFACFALGSGEDDSKKTTQAKGEAETTVEENEKLGDYAVEILSCRLAKDFEGKDVVIVKYKFTNNSDKAANFMFAFDDSVFQDGVGLNDSLFVDESAKYSADNQQKDIKPGTSLEVECAYELNDTKTDVEVEVKELISFDEKTITKTFSIAK
ncbi:MAG: DUF5067 domain-containing protein [Clostridia bacterium]|nr:DUF5067 domain-containing protein [Clostridia bacterium]